MSFLENFFSDNRFTVMTMGDRAVVVALIVLSVFLLRRKNELLQDIGVSVAIAVVLWTYLPLGIVVVILVLTYNRLKRYFARLATKPGYLAGAILFGILLGVLIEIGLYIVPILIQAHK